MDNRRLMALGLLKSMVDAGRLEYEMAWLVGKSELSGREIARGLAVLEEWGAVVVKRELVREKPRIASVTLSEETAYRVYREIFGHGPPS